MYVHPNNITLLSVALYKDKLWSCTCIWCSPIGWVNGTPSRLLYPVDSKGRLCGFTEGVELVRYTVYCIAIFLLSILDICKCSTITFNITLCLLVLNATTIDLCMACYQGMTSKQDKLVHSLQLVCTQKQT